jgi:hypothetical protein
MVKCFGHIPFNFEGRTLSGQPEGTPALLCSFIALSLFPVPVQF